MIGKLSYMIKRVYYSLAVWRFKPILSAGLRFHSYLSGGLRLRDYRAVAGNQVPIVRKVDNAIHRINHYPVDSVVCFVNTYPLDSDLFGG